MTRRFVLAPLALAAGLAATPALADEGGAGIAAVAEAEAEATAEADVQAQPAARPAGTPPPFAFAKPVFDDTWATIGLGVGMVPSYVGSDDYIAFPLPVIAGRLGGVGIAPNGAGFVLDVNSPKPAMGPRKGARVAFGPALRVRLDRAIRITDVVVARAGKLDPALEVGGNVAVNIPGVIKPFDTLSIGVQARWDVLGAHEGMVIEPQISYRALLGKGFTFQAQASAEFVDDNFADYYFSVSAAQAAATGLARFRAEGGLNRVGTTATLSYDLDRNPLNGGWAVNGIGGYSRLVGDSVDTPYTAVRGDANQFIIGLGAAFTF